MQRFNLAGFALVLTVIAGRPVRAGHVDAGADAVAVELDPQIVAQTVRSGLGALKQCYQRALGRNRGLSGRTVAHWTIDASGMAKRIEWRSDEIGDPAFTACATQVIEQWQFRPPPTRPVEVSFPFVFKVETTPEEIARSWLNAIGRGDKLAIQGKSAFPLTIEGFNLESGTERDACYGKSRSDGLAGVRSFHAVDSLKVVVDRPEDIERGLGCLLQDRFLRDDVPHQNPDGSWPAAARNNKDHVSGTSKVVTPERLSKHLRRYRAIAKLLAKDHTLVEAIMTDNDGETTSVLVALRPDPERHFVVDAAYVDELFEE